MRRMKWKLKAVIACVVTATSYTIFVFNFSSDCRDLGCEERTNSRTNSKKASLLIHKQVKVPTDIDLQSSNVSIDKSRHAAEAAAPMFIDIDQSVPDIDALYGQLVVVTAFSLNHMKEAMGMIATAQKIMPQVKIIVYDIGLLEEEAIKKVSTLCNVELRTFNFKKYPRYVSSLLKYAWKVIIIKETLNEFGAIFWADASVRFTKSLKSLLPYAVEHHGYLSRIHSYRALNVKPITHNYYFTNDRMFKSFGIDKKEYSQSPYAPHPAANRQLIINSTTVQLKYMRPMYTCALNKTCISPKGARYGIHRFDASALMLVIHKFFPNEFNRENDHVKDFDDTMFVDRVSAYRFNATYCPATKHPSHLEQTS